MKSQEKDLRKLKNILDAKYQKVDLDQEVDNMDHLSNGEKKKLLNFLKNLLCKITIIFLDYFRLTRSKLNS